MALNLRPQTPIQALTDSKGLVADLRDIRSSMEGLEVRALQGYLAHKKPPLPKDHHMTLGKGPL